MKRDWDLIREVLIEVEELTTHNRRAKQYEIRVGQPSETDTKVEQVLLLYKAGFIDGIDAGAKEGPCIMGSELTWAGQDLLETMRSKPIWNKIKSIAQEKGLELTFDTVKALGKLALGLVLADTSSLS